MSAGINTFLKAVVREGTMPFEIKTNRSSPQKKCRNATLNHAFIVKKDEFYTQYEDVAKEMVKHGDKLRRSEEHTSELQSLMRISYAVFCLKKKKHTKQITKKKT